MAPVSADAKVSVFSPYALADAKRKRFMLGTGVVQFVFGGFLLLPVLFVLSLTVPILVILLVWLTITGLIGMLTSRWIRPTVHTTPNCSPDPARPPATSPPPNTLFKLYITLQTAAFLLGLVTLIIGATIVHDRIPAFNVFHEETAFRDLSPSDRAMFGIATIVLGAWLACVELIMVLLAAGILRKHYYAVARALGRGQPVINIEKCPDNLLRGVDQFEEDFLPMNNGKSGGKKSPTGRVTVSSSLLSVAMSKDSQEEQERRQKGYGAVRQDDEDRFLDDP